jgi:hypothetical protein
MNRKGTTNRLVNTINDGYLNLIGAVLNGVDNYPHYSMCSCAKNWADIGGIDINTIYERARRGTEWESVPLEILDHPDWVKKDKQLRRTEVT